MAIIKKMRKQNAVYWERDGVDSQGRPKWKLPVAIKCRWEDRVEVFLDTEGEERNSRAVIYVDRDTKPGGYLWLSPLAGTQTEADVLAGAPANPRNDSNAHEIKRFDRLPNLRARQFLLTAMV